MKIRNIAIGLVVSIVISVQAQETDANYRRSSIYSVLVNHTDQQFASEIKEAFLQIPVPDKFNDHNLSVKVLNLDKKLSGASSEKENPIITEFLDNNKVASRLVDGLTVISSQVNVIWNLSRSEACIMRQNSTSNLPVDLHVEWLCFKMQEKT